MVQANIQTSMDLYLCSTHRIPTDESVLHLLGRDDSHRWWHIRSLQRVQAKKKLSVSVYLFEKDIETGMFPNFLYSKQQPLSLGSFCTHHLILFSPQYNYATL